MPSYDRRPVYFDNRRSQLSREDRTLLANRGRFASKRTSLIMEGREHGNAYLAVTKGPTSARPPFAPDEVEPNDDDPEAN